MTPRSRVRGLFGASLAFLAVSLTSSTITFARDLVFGPVTCQRGPGAPTVFDYSFTTSPASQGYIFKVYNGGLEDTTYEQVSSSTITLNGVQIIGPGDFNQKVACLEAPVVLQEHNTLKVEVRGKPGGAMIIKAYPLVAIDSPAEGQVFGTDPVTVSGRLYSAVTSVSVNGIPGTVSADTFSVAGIALVQGSNTLTATAAREDGFSGASSVRVTLDSVPPTIGGLAPAPGAAISEAQVAISASFSDALSGIEASSTRLMIDGADVTPGAVLSEQNILYRPTTPLPDGAHHITLLVHDRAGNLVTASWSFVVDTASPKITVLSPAEGASVAAATVDLFGSVDDPTATVTMNGTAVTLTGTDFSALGYAMARGSNTIHIEAHDALGNSSSVALHVSYVPPSPTASLAATPSQVQIGGGVALQWTTNNASSVSIAPNIGMVAVNGSMTVTPSATTTYTLSATGPGGTATTQVTVTVNGGGGPPPPEFTAPTLTAHPASIPRGAYSTLWMNIPPARSCSIDQGVGTVQCNGLITVSPAITTTYTLTVIGFTGTTTAMTTVTVTAPLPVVTIAASPIEIQPGADSMLSWSSTNAESCSISGVGAVPLSGAMTVSPSVTTNYLITAEGLGGSRTSSIVVTVKYPAPTVAISAAPTEIMLGESATLSWSSTNAGSCAIDQGIGLVACSGTMMVSPGARKTYTIIATGQGGTTAASVSVMVKYLAPTVTMIVSPTEIVLGESATVSWSSTNASYCVINFGIGIVATSGQMIISPSSATIRTYSITAYGPGGAVATAEAQVRVKFPAPTGTLVAEPEKVLLGASTTLSWSSTNAYQCFIQGIGPVECNSAGFRTVIPTETTTYSLIATGYSGTAIVHTTVTVEFPPVTVSIVASPSTIHPGETAILTWSSTNASSCSLNPGFGAIPCNGTQTVNPSGTTTYTLTVTGPGGTMTSQAAVIVAQPTGNVSISASPSTIHLGGTAILTWTATDVTGVLINQRIGQVQPAGTIVVKPTSTTEYVLTAAGTEGASQASALVTVLGNVQPQPEGSFGARYQDQIPQDATVASYDAKRFSLVTGTVRDRNNQPVAGVSVSILSHSEYGTVMTNDEGDFTLPVEGGGTVTVSYKKTEYLTTHRQVVVPWNDIALVETITMIPEDIAVTKITFNGDASTVIVHQSTVVADEYGSRSATIVFTGDNTAYAKVDDKTIRLNTIDVRATEFDTPNSMPAKLPPTSAYTYCSDLSVDGAKDVTFDKPVTVYVDNFLGFNVGEIVPVGYYDRNKGVWVASDNGVVVRLLDTNGDGIVDALDTIGDGLPHDANIAGLNDPTKFNPNATYWRMRVSHFTPWDLNWPYGPPISAIQPNPEGNPVADQKQPCDDLDKTNSYCERRSRVFHEDIPIAGTDMTLHYASNRVPGYMTVVTIPASGQTVPTSLTRIVVRMEVAGRLFETALPPSPNQKVNFIWDGSDYLGNQVVGTSIARISIGFGYWWDYLYANNEFRAWAATSSTATGIRAREEQMLWKSSNSTLQRSGLSQFAEGWTLPIYHLLSPSDPAKLFKGDGMVIDNDAITIITTIAGNGLVGFSGDGGSATQATINRPDGVSVDKVGNLYIADTFNHRIRKIDTNGIITTVAGNGQGGFSGDGGHATQAKLYYPTAATMDSSGNLYIADYENYRIRKVDARGIITTVAGNGILGFSGDGGPAAQAMLSYPQTVTIDSAGNLYLADIDNNRIRKVDTSGIITTVAGNGQRGFSGDGGSATQAKITHPWGLAVDSAANLYIADTANYRIRKVDTSGIITTVAGNGLVGFSGDGGPATQAKLTYPLGVTVDSAGNIYIADWSRIRKVNTSGIITTVAGNGLVGFSGDGGPATQAKISLLYGLAMDSTGTIYFVDRSSRIRKIAKPIGLVQSGAPGDITFTDENGLGYIMSSTGLQKSTFDLSTGKPLLTFGHNAADQLVSFTDRFGNQTTIQRDSTGKPTSITSPDGIVTSLDVDSANRLTQASYPDGSYYSFGYTSNGLMTEEYDRKGSLFVHDYDSDGRITHVFDPEGGTWNYSRTIDNAGSVFSNVLTGENNLFAYQDKTDTTGTYTSVKTEPTGEVTTITRAADGLTESTSSSCGMKESRQYNLDTEYLFKYISAATTTTPADLRLTTAYSRTYQDNNGDKVPELITDLASKNSRTWTITNNSVAGIVTRTSPDGRKTTSQYDPATLLTQQVNIPGLYPTAFSYDIRGRLVSTTTGNRTTTVTYDTNGYNDSIITPDNRNVDYTYDIMGRLQSEVRPDGSVVDYQYDANGNPAVLTNPDDVQYYFGFTANNQRENFVQPLSGTYRYRYDKDRRLKTVTLPSGEAITNAYVQGNLSTTSTPEGVANYDYLCGSRLGSAILNGESVAFGYDGPLVTSDTRSGTLAKAINYTYNNDFAVISVSYAGTTANLGYDNDGLLTAVGIYAISRNAQNGLPESVSGLGLTQSRSFNGYGELDGSVSSVGGTQVYSWSVPARDNAGRILRREEYIDGTTVVWEYSYNAVGRLTEVKKDGVVAESYTYDANGNRLSKEDYLRGISLESYALSIEDHVLSAGTDTCQFDVNGYLMSKTSAEGTTSYAYSSRGELLRVDRPDGNILSYVHDPFGRRISKQVNGSAVEKYLWKDQTTLLAVYDGNDSLLQRFTYADTRMPVSMTAGGATYFLLTDQVGTLRAVADTSGAIVKRIDYDSFGNIIADTNPSFSVPFGFAGGLHDRDTGLVRFGARDYDPAMGRFTAKDPIDFAGGDTNLYAYVASDPVNLTDPAGLYISPWHGLVSYYSTVFATGNPFTAMKAAFQSALYDFMGTQGTEAWAANSHSMGGVDPVTGRQSTEGAKKGFCDSLANAPETGFGTHAIEDSFPHAFAPWGGGFPDAMHILRDTVPRGWDLAGAFLMDFAYVRSRSRK